MPLEKAAWLATVLVALVATVLLVLADYFGYAGVVSAVGLAAAINLR